MGLVGDAGSAVPLGSVEADVDVDVGTEAGVGTVSPGGMGGVSVRSIAVVLSSDEVCWRAVPGCSDELVADMVQR